MTHFIKCLFLALSIFFLNNKSSAQLSDKAQISLLTCAEGEDIYSLFGHSAIRVNDPINNIDNCYNWGMFEFDSDDKLYLPLNSLKEGSNTIWTSKILDTL